MLLLDVATTSLDVGATSSRLSKVERIADLLRRAAPDPELVAIIVAWLSGELPQRHIGVGWASLRSLPLPAGHPTLTVAGVDAAFSEIGATSGSGSQARRAQLVSELFSAATESEQTLLLRLLSGELRQGALTGIMTDAVAKAAAIPASAVQRAAMLGGDLPAVAAAGLTGGRRRWTPSPYGWAGRWARCWRRPRPVWRTRSNATTARRYSRPSWTVPEYRFTAPATTSPSSPEASTTSPLGCRRSWRQRWRCRCASWSPMVRRSRCDPTTVRIASRSPRPGSADRSM
ncbi:DNA ligase family protein [Mycobacterium kansasii 732]|nr:DNA ligase family protein [Mycobacterium kansasii 732]